MTDSTLKEQDDISKERFAAFMAFLPKQLCIRYLMVEDDMTRPYEWFHAQIVYVGIISTEMAELRAELSFVDKVNAHAIRSPFIYQNERARIEGQVEAILKNWENIAGNGGGQEHWLQPKPFVGIRKTPTGIEELGASDPRFMLYHGLLIAQIDLLMTGLKTAAKFDRVTAERVQVLDHLRQRFNAFVIQNQLQLKVQLGMQMQIAAT